MKHITLTSEELVDATANLERLVFTQDESLVKTYPGAAIDSIISEVNNTGVVNTDSNFITLNGTAYRGFFNGDKLHIKVDDEGTACFEQTYSPATGSFGERVRITSEEYHRRFSLIPDSYVCLYSTPDFGFSSITIRANVYDEKLIVFVNSIIDEFKRYWTDK